MKKLVTTLAVCLSGFTLVAPATAHASSAIMSLIPAERIYIEEFRNFATDYIYVEQTINGQRMRGYLQFIGGGGPGYKYAGYVYPASESVPAPTKVKPVLESE